MPKKTGQSGSWENSEIHYISYVSQVMAEFAMKRFPPLGKKNAINTSQEQVSDKLNLVCKCYKVKVCIYVCKNHQVFHDMNYKQYKVLTQGKWK